MSTDNTWTNGNSTGVWNDTANWDQSRVPTVGDNAVFQGAVSTDNCRVDAVVTVDEIRSEGAYSGTIDFATDNLNITTDDSGGGSGDMLWNAGTILAGSGTHDCDGDFYSRDATAWTRGTSTLIMRGTGKILSSRYVSRSFYSLEIYGTISTAGGYPGVYCYGGMAIKDGGELLITYRFNFYGALGLTIESGGELIVGNSSGDRLSSSGDLYNKLGGTVSGPGSAYFTSGGEVLENAGTWTVADTYMGRGGTRIAGGTYAGDKFTFYHGYSTGGTMNYRLGYLTPAVVFDCDVDVIGRNGITLNFDADYYDCDVTFNGNLIFEEPDGTALFFPSTTYPVEFAATSNYTDTTAAGINLGDIIISGDVVLLTDMECDDFVSVSGGSFDTNGFDMHSNNDTDWASGFTILDPAGSNFEIGGDFTANGQAIAASAPWTMDITGSAVALGTGAVNDCDATGIDGTEVDASDGPWDDNDDNTNWNFGVVPRVSRGMTSGMQVLGGGIL